MSIFPPTDIVMDVAQAADPTRVNAAVRRLNSPSNSQAAAEGAFDAALVKIGGGALPSSSPVAAAWRKPSVSAKAPPPQTDAASAAAVKFEAFILQSFIETLLPKEGSSVFGHEAGSGVWRSMMAEQLGNQIAKAGGVGLQKLLYRQTAAS